jgi:hypothetical protein
MYDTIWLLMLGLGIITAIRLTKQYLQISYNSFKATELPIKNKGVSEVVRQKKQHSSI